MAELREVISEKAKETDQALDLGRHEILGENTVDPIAAFAVNENVWVEPIDDLR